MGAILGRLARDGQPVNPTSFQAAMQALADFGPDGADTQFISDIALGRHLMRVSAHPAVGLVQTGQRIVAADAVLGDRAGLAGKLGIDTGALRDCNDDDLLLAAFDKWGPDCVHHLSGDWAFAIYDLEKRQLVLARDALGARPLYWRTEAGTFVFATDIRGLVAFDDLSWDIDESAVARFLASPSRAATTGFYRGIQILKGGTRLIVDAGGVTQDAWWNPADAPSIRHTRTKDYTDAFREILTEVTAERAWEGATVGSHFSAGIDSTTVAVLASKALGAHGSALKACYTWAPVLSDKYPDMGRWDERRKMKEFADARGLAVRYSYADGVRLRKFLERPIELEGTSNLDEELPIIEQAGADGIRVLLSGWGGDEAFSAHGIGYLAWLVKRGRLREALKHTIAINNGRRRPRALMRLFVENGLMPLLPDAVFHRINRYETAHVSGCFINPELEQAHPDEHPDPANWIRIVPDPGAYMNILLQSGHIGSRIQSWSSWAAPYGIQYGYPLIDRRVVEYILGLPYDLLYHDGRGRFMARASMAEDLPPDPVKYDPANTALRDANTLECWRVLAEDLKQGQFESDCDWLDMPAVRAAISDVPEDVSAAAYRKFGSIFAATRIWHLYQRHFS